MDLYSWCVKPAYAWQEGDFMKWQEIREQYPKTWLLVEALQAHSENDKRVLDQLAVVNTFLDGQTAMGAYAKLHHEFPTREFFVLHTDREQLDITIRRWLGIRGI